MKHVILLVLLCPLSGLVAQSPGDGEVMPPFDALSSKTIVADSLWAVPERVAQKQWSKVKATTDVLRQSMNSADTLLGRLTNIDTLLQAKTRRLQYAMNQLQEKLNPSKLQKTAKSAMANIKTTAHSISGGVSNPLDSLSTRLSGDHLLDQLPDPEVLDEAIAEQLPKLPADKKRLAEQYNEELDRLGGAVNHIKKGIDGGALDTDQLGRYTENLKALESQWTAHSSLLEEIRQGTLTPESPNFKLLEDKLGELSALEAVKSALPSTGDDPLEAFFPSPDIPDHYQKLQDLQQQAKDWIQKSNIKPKQTLGEAKGQLDALKEKYINVPSSLDMGSAIRKNSLKQKPLKERLVIGGNMDFSLDPLSIEVAPTLGYQLNRLWQVGVATYWQHHFEEGTNAEDSERYNVSGYTQYRFWKGVLLHGEYRLMRHQEEETIDKELYWRGEGYGGIGKTISIKGSWQAQLLVLYNFSHDRHTPFTERWSTRWGVTRNLSFGKDKSE